MGGIFATLLAFAVVAMCAWEDRDCFHKLP